MKDLQYKDYSEWMRTRDLSEQREYWLKEFSGNLPILNLPLDFTRPKIQSFNGDTISFDIDNETAKNIRQVMNDNSVTEYMYFLSVVMILLAKYSREEDIIIGSPVSSRLNSDTAAMFGMFANTLAMRAQPEADKTFQTFLNEVKSKCLNAYANQEYSFDELLEELNIKRDISRNPIFDVMVVMQNNEKCDLVLEGTDLEFVDDDRKISKFDITFKVFPKDDIYNIVIEYCTELFTEKTITNIKKHFINTMNQVNNNQLIHIRDIEFITEREKHIILNEFNHPIEKLNKGKFVMDFFEEEVERNPEKIAIIDGVRKYTYSDLNNRANYIAKMLVAKEVNVNDFVMIITTRSIEMMVGIFAILKAGAAYVPIAVDTPRKRIDYIVSDCKPKAILTDQPDMDYGTDRVIHLDHMDSYEETTQNPIRKTDEDSYAYCIYTSGTTGTPKGVINMHKGLINRLIWMKDHYKADESDVVLQKTTYTFDVSVGEILMWCICGASLCLLPNKAEKDPEVICDEVEKNKITRIHFVPSMLNMFLAYLKNNKEQTKKLSSLRHVYCSGEALKMETVNNFNQILSNEKLSISNLYGPTESSIEVTYYDFDTTNNVVPIGKPISNVNVYIIDDHKLCGMGVPGEICLAGIGVAKGYLNQSELTKEKFVDDPYGEGKMYFTGDLGRWLNDGNIEYLGRIDDQVKIRGFRIELGEIENEIRKISYVKDCVVIAKEDQNNEKFVNAYIVSDKKIDKLEIKNALSTHLPEYMIPTYMEQIDEIPVTANGKLDKKNLPEIKMLSETVYEGPRNRIEEILCRAYEQILNVDQVGINDDFFELGGHSLRAIRLLNIIEQETGMHIGMRSIFNISVIKNLAKILNEKNITEVTQIQKTKDAEYVPMSSAQKRIYMVYKMDEESIAYNMPVAIRVEGKLDSNKVNEVLNMMSQRHEILRTEFVETEEGLFQHILDNITVDYTYEEVKEKSIDTLIDEFIAPFHLRQAPLFRAKLVVMENCNLLLFDVHHIISDGDSNDIFIKEFIDLYENKTCEMPKLQYKDYCEWMKEKDISSEKEYWKKELEGEIPVINLPTDFVRPQIQSFNGKTVEVKTGQTVSENIEKLAKTTKTTEYMIFLSTAMILLGKYSNQEDVIIGTISEGRNQSSLNNMLGMFVNTLAMRGYPEKTKTFIEFLNEIKDKCLNAYENQDYPFNELVEDIGIKREASHNPIFDVVLTMQNSSVDTQKIDGKVIEFIPTQAEGSKFDLTFLISKCNDGYLITVRYNSDLFMDTTVNRMLHHYLEIINQINNNINILINEIKLITKEEESKILIEFNHKNISYNKEKTVVDLFEEQVARTPDHIALEYEDKKLTYHELNMKANQLARKLRNMSVTTDDCVVIIAQRSIELLVGIMGIIKSGAGYVPIDVTCPNSRIQYIIHDCNPKVILTYKVDESIIEEKEKILDLGQADSYETYTADKIEKINTPNDLLYCIYTSGTTGVPKGVMVEHRNLNRLLYNDDQFYDFNENDRWLLFHSYSFDFSVWEIFGALLFGGELVIVPSEIVQDSYRVGKLIKEKGITVLNQVPSSFYNLMNMLNGDDIKIRYLIFGGERLNPRIIEKWFYTHQNIQIINMYGATETTVHTTLRIVDKDVIDRGISNIGKAIPTLQVYICNNNNLCGIGIPGEMCVTGAGVARGYLNKEQLTKDRFIDNPYGEGKMYKTGDLGRWLPNGDIEYLGRIDKQVKIRGYRIELGEIENVIKKIEGIDACIPIVKKDKSGDEAIFAYYVSKQNISTTYIREFLGKSLPNYMIPAHIGQIQSIPLTTNGKLDTTKLPDIDICTDEYERPEGKTEEILIHIFEEVLGIKDLSMKANFFELGGDSIKAIRIVSKMREQGLIVTVRNIMQKFVIKEIAKTIETVTNIEYEQGEVTGIIADTPIVKHFGARHYKKASHYNLSVKLQTEIDEDVAQKTLDMLFMHHDILRSVYRNGRLEILNRLKARKYQFSVFHISSDENIDHEIAMINKEIEGNMDLENGPLMTSAFIYTDKKNYLLLCFHHLIVDGISLRILTDDFVNISNQIKQKKLVVMPMKTASYFDWANSLEEYKQSNKLKTELSYWQNVINKMQDGKIKLGQPECAMNQRQYFEFKLTEEQTKNLVQNAGRAFNTEINDLLLAALGMAVYKLTGQEILSIALEGHGREEIHKKIDIDRTVGWFTSMYPVITECKKDIEDSIITNKEIIHSIPNHGLGFGMLYSYENIVADIYFHYMGEIDAEDDSTCELITDDTIAKENSMFLPINIFSIIQNKCLEISVTYDQLLFDKEHMNRFAQFYNDSLLNIIDVCINQNESITTASDFGNDKLNMEELDEIQNMFN